MNTLRGAAIIIAIIVGIFNATNIVSAVSLYHMVYPDSRHDMAKGEKTITFGMSWYDRVNNKYYKGHLGEDYLLDIGTPVYAIADGEVSMVRNWPGCDTAIETNHGWGGVVQVAHTRPTGKPFATQGTIITTSSTQYSPKKVHSLYGHIENIQVETGDTVVRGQLLGFVAKVCPYIPHLHFEIKDEEGFLYDEQHSSGPGFGYSGGDMYAPHRYRASSFIENHSFLLAYYDSIEEAYVASFSRPATLFPGIEESLQESLRSILADLLPPLPATTTNQQVAHIDSQLLRHDLQLASVLAHQKQTDDSLAAADLTEEFEELEEKILGLIDTMVVAREEKEDDSSITQATSTPSEAVEPVVDDTPSSEQINVEDEEKVDPVTIVDNQEHTTTTIQTSTAVVIEPIYFKDPFSDFSHDVVSKTLHLTQTTSPYLWVSSDSATPTIPAGHTLIIDPGVSILAIEPGVEIVNEGVLNLNGTKAHPISISASSSIQWSSMINRGTLNLSHVNMVDGGKMYNQALGSVYAYKNISASIINDGGVVRTQNLTLDHISDDSANIAAALVQLGDHPQMLLQQAIITTDKLALSQRISGGEVSISHSEIKNMTANVPILDVSFGEQDITHTMFTGLSNIVDMGEVQVVTQTIFTAEMTPLVSHIIIEPQADLIVDQGTTLLFHPQADIIVKNQGSFMAQGTVDAPITLDAISGQWGSIIARASSTIVLAHTTLSRGNNSRNTESGQGVITGKQCRIMLESSRLWNNRRPYRIIDIDSCELNIGQSHFGYDTSANFSRLAGIRGKDSVVTIDRSSTFTNIPTPFELQRSEKQVIDSVL